MSSAIRRAAGAPSHGTLLWRMSYIGLMAALFTSIDRPPLCAADFTDTWTANTLPPLKADRWINYTQPWLFSPLDSSDPASPLLIAKCELSLCVTRSLDGVIVATLPIVRSSLTAAATDDPIVAFEQLVSSGEDDSVFTVFYYQSGRADAVELAIDLRHNLSHVMNQWTVLQTEAGGFGGYYAILALDASRDVLYAFVSQPDSKGQCPVIAVDLLQNTTTSTPLHFPCQALAAQMASVDTTSGWLWLLDNSIFNQDNVPHLLAFDPLNGDLMATLTFEVGWFGETCKGTNGAFAFLIDSPNMLIHVAGYWCNFTTSLLTLNASTGEQLRSIQLPGQSLINGMRWLPPSTSTEPPSGLAWLLDVTNTRIFSVDLGAGAVLGHVEFGGQGCWAGPDKLIARGDVLYGMNAVRWSVKAIQQPSGVVQQIYSTYDTSPDPYLLSDFDVEAPENSSTARVCLVDRESDNIRLLDNTGQVEYVWSLDEIRPEWAAFRPHRHQLIVVGRDSQNVYLFNISEGQRSVTPAATLRLPSGMIVERMHLPAHSANVLYLCVKSSASIVRALLNDSDGTVSVDERFQMTPLPGSIGAAALTSVNRADVLLFTEVQQCSINMLDLHNGTLLARWNLTGCEWDALNSPWGIAVQADRWLYVSVPLLTRVAVIDLYAVPEYMTRLRADENMAAAVTQTRHRAPRRVNGASNMRELSSARLLAR